MEAEHPDNFNQRMSQWIANQGFWFQLRYSMSGGGGWSVAFSNLLRMAFRGLVVLLLAAVVFGIYLTKRVDSNVFKESLRSQFAEAVGAEEAELVDFRRAQGVVTIRRLGAEGSESSFFDSLEAGNLRFNMKLVDGLSKKWNPGVIQANWIDAEVKGGANSAEDAKQAVKVFFDEFPGFHIEGVESTNTRISWGYSERTYGEISGSKLEATRVGTSWRLIFRGGYFTQNWIKRFELEELVFLLKPEELVVEKGSLRSGSGRVTFKDVKVDGGEFPQVSGQLKFKSIPLASLVPEKVRALAVGSISGDFELSGSTNSPEGVGFTGKVNLSESDQVSIRDRFPLLETLDIVDVFNNYKRVDFNSGSFEAKTGDGKMEITKLNISAGDLMSLQGRLTIRQPTMEEAAREAGLNPGAVLDPFVSKEDPKERGDDISLKRAAEQAKRDVEKEEDGEEVENIEFFSDLQREKEEARLKREARERVLGALIFSGGFRMTISGDAFDRSQVLRERFPQDPATGRIGIDVPLEGGLFELTLKQAEELYRLGSKGTGSKGTK